MPEWTARDGALRALAEGARPTLALLSDVSGRSHDRLKATAEREGWALDRFAPGDIVNRIRAVTEPLLTHVEALGRKALEEGGRVEKGEIEAIIGIIRSLEKIGEIMRPGADAPAAKENQIRQDEDMAATLDRINGRMVELARELAAQMVAEECRAGRCRARRWGVAR
jgi:hypothetical protein